MTGCNYASELQDFALETKINEDPIKEFFCHDDLWYKFMGFDKQNGLVYRRVRGERVIVDHKEWQTPHSVVDISSTSISDNRLKSVVHLRLRQSIPANGERRQIDAGEIFHKRTYEFDFKTNSGKLTLWDINLFSADISNKEIVVHEQCIPIKFEFAPTPTDFENFLNINVAWGKGKKVEFTNLSRCNDDMRSSSAKSRGDDERISVYHEYFCRNGFVRETTPLGIQNCELEKVTAEKEDNVNTRDMSDTRMGVTEYDYQKGECRWQNKE